MKNSIVLENISVAYKEKQVLENLNWKVKNNSFTVLVGKNGCGKTTLLKAMLGLLKMEGTVRIKDILLEKATREEIYHAIAVVFDNVHANFLCETVMAEFKMILKNKGMKEKERKEKIEEICSTLHITELQNRMITHLSGGEKQLVAFAAAMMIEPEILLLDEPFTMVDSVMKDFLMNFLKEYQKKHKITVILITNDVEDVVYGTDIAILDHGKIKKYASKKGMLKDEKLWKEAHLELPFMADLSLKLKYYGLVEEPILEIDKMVKYLWK